MSSLVEYIVLGMRRDERETTAFRKASPMDGQSELAVVLEGLKGQESIAEICRRHGITQLMPHTRRTYGSGGELLAASRLENELYQKNKIARPSTEEVVAFYDRPSAPLA